MKSEPAEEQNPDAESAAQETKEKAAEEVKEEPKDQEEEKEQQPEAAAADAEVEEKDRSLTDPSLEEQKPAAMAAPPPVADIKFNITTKVSLLNQPDIRLSAFYSLLNNSIHVFPGGEAGAAREHGVDERVGVGLLLGVRRGRRGAGGAPGAGRAEAQAEGARPHRAARAEQGLGDVRPLLHHVDRLTDLRGRRGRR